MPSLGTAICAGCVAAVLILPIAAAAPQNAPQERPPQPLILESQGSFFVGGRLNHTAVRGTQNGGVFSTPTEDDIMVDQMYVQYQVPQNHGAHVPVVMVH